MRVGSSRSLVWAWSFILCCGLGLLDSEHLLLGIHSGLRLDRAIFTVIGGDHTARREHGGLVQWESLLGDLLGAVATLEERIPSFSTFMGLQYLHKGF